MGRIKLDDIEKYSSGANSFFQLKDDGDTEKVRVMYEDLDDVDAYLVHKVKIGQSEKYVSCLKSEQNCDCPLCNSGSKPIIRLFIPLYSLKDDKVKLWERGKSMIKRLQKLCDRYNPLYKTVLEIERNGAAGDNQTDYAFYNVETTENLSLDDLPEIPEVLGGYVLDKTEEELAQFVATGQMPGEDSTTKSERDIEKDTQPPRRRTTNTRRQVF